MSEYNIGTKLRKIRKDRMQTLKDVAKNTDISPSMLSMIENEISNPSIGTISKLVKYYDIRISRLFLDNQNKVRYDVVRKNNKERIRKNNNNNVYNVENNLADKKLKCTLVRLKKSCILKKLDKTNIETFIYVINGKVNIYNSSEVYHVEEGDSIHFIDFKEIRLDPIAGTKAKIMRVERE